MHVLHLILNNFEEIAFGKLPITMGFSKTRHPFNLLYLVWMLHNGYDPSDKDSPLNIKSETIQDLERRNIHIEFVAWFLLKLKSLKKALHSYIQKWELFQSWLNDSELNIEIQCLVKFGQEFYRPFAEFLVGYDPQLKII